MLEQISAVLNRLYSIDFELKPEPVTAMVVPAAEPTEGLILSKVGVIVRPVRFSWPEGVPLAS